MSRWYVKQNDSAGLIRAQLLTEDDVPVDLEAANRVDFHMRPPGGSPADVKVNARADIDDAPIGMVSYSWQDGDTDTPGEFYAEWQVTWQADGSVQTFPNWTNDTVRVTREQA